ncbi:MAG TPA: hypothetical protein VKN99_03690 [Polyangia bacterium]|nr:hypothetical protein [Polyangia bacterium]
MQLALYGLWLAGPWAVAVVPVDPADASLAQDLSSVLEASVAELTHAPVVASEDFRAHMGLTGRSILDCAADAACIRRAGEALRVERILVGQVSRGVGDEFILNVKLIEVATAKMVRNTIRQARGVEALIEQSKTVIADFGRGPLPEPQPSAPPPASERSSSGWLPYVVGGVGVAVAATGTILVLSVGGDYDHLKQTCAPSCDPGSWSGLHTRVETGYVLIGVGAAAVATGAVLWLLQPRSGRPERRAWILPTLGGVTSGVRF